jgi:hypothetical protein
MYVCMWACVWTMKVSTADREREVRTLRMRPEPTPWALLHAPRPQSSHAASFLEAPTSVSPVSIGSTRRSGCCSRRPPRWTTPSCARGGCGGAGASMGWATSSTTPTGTPWRCVCVCVRVCVRFNMMRCAAGAFSLPRRSHHTYHPPSASAPQQPLTHPGTHRSTPPPTGPPG